jgi:hypothetical protein
MIAGYWEQQTLVEVYGDAMVALCFDTDAGFGTTADGDVETGDF